MSDVKRLTDRPYWEQYYRGAADDRESITHVCAPYDRYFDLAARIARTPPRSLIELGCYPGRFLAYFASRYNLRAVGVDFNADDRKIANSMAAMGVHEYEYVQQDLLSYRPTATFDIVFSGGLIEHFEDYDRLLELHADLVADGGVIIVTVPNLRYLRYFFGILLDRANLRTHNLAPMRLKTFAAFAARRNLDIVHLGYHGGFPYNVHQKLNLLQRALYYPTRRIFKVLNPVLANHPSRFYSGGIVAVLQKQLRG